MYYIARYSDTEGFICINSANLEKRVFSEAELLSYIKGGNRLFNLENEGKCHVGGIRAYLSTYCDQFYKYLGNVSHVEIVEDTTFEDARFEINEDTLRIVNNYNARIARGGLFYIQRSDFWCSSQLLDSRGIIVYAQGYEYLVNLTAMHIGGIYFNGKNYVVCIGSNTCGLHECVLYPGIEDDYIRCIGAIEYRSFKRKILLCGI